MRIASKRHSTVSCPRPEPRDSCLESALHNFLSTAPEGVTRCRKNILPTMEGSPGMRRSQTFPPVEKTEATPPTGQQTPEKKQPKLQEEDEKMAEPVNKEEAEKMRQITVKVLHYQNSKSSLDGDRVSGSPCPSERSQDAPSTPSTPRPRTRDFFFANNGDVGSPWTILSPFTCSQMNTSYRNRHQRRPSAPAGNDLDDGVWEIDKGNNLPNSSSHDNPTSPSEGAVSLPECPSQRAVSHGPILRSVSMDESTRSPAPGFRLGDLFQRGMSQRSYSSGSRTETMREGAGICSLPDRKGGNHAGQVSTSGFISFFRRIGGRNKPGDVEEHNFKGSNT